MVTSVVVKPGGPRAATVNNRWCGEGLRDDTAGTAHAVGETVMCHLTELWKAVKKG